ncbi:MAG: DUF6807 family protein [Bacteroidia bacterium]|nr:DUF6807 family protein [Bacteroidia bacterium]
MKNFILLLFSATLILGNGCKQSPSENTASPSTQTLLYIQQDTAAGTIAVFRAGETTPILTQNAKPDFRPYLHPIVAPDGKGLLTEYSPGHHKHQTGIYWGFTRVNGRDFFHHPEGDYWRRVSAQVVENEGTKVKWQTVYDMLGEAGEVLLTETQNWSMHVDSGRFFIELEWLGTAQTDITIGKYDYGGLFVRMPWQEGIKGEVINAARQRNEKAEGQRAMWVDVGMQVEGRENLAHIAVFDHPENEGFPQTWRVDGQMGIGPARARMGDWSIKKDETEIIRHQLVAYTGDLSDIEMTKAWGIFVGNESMYSTTSLWGIAQQEGREAKFLTPQEAVETMTIQDGFQVNVWAAEPMITQPMAFCWDDRGRLWIAENRDYETRGTGFSNFGDSRIIILEDTDHDGKADSKKIFLEDIPFPAAIAVGFDGLYLGAPPNLLFVPDRNADDRADMADIEVRLTGWGILDRHETLNSLHWGPDGWLYGLEGFATPSKIRKPEGKGKIYRHKEPFPEDILEGEGTEINGGVWRYHPVKDRFEVVAHGFSNPWGVDFDAKGQMFISACVIPHLWHVIPGGIYMRQGGRHFNPYVYGDIQTIADHRHRSAHGGARIYLSDAFPPEHQGRIFMANIHEHAVLSDVLEPRGSGFAGHHGDDFLLANNAQWIGFSMEIGPEGGLYVLDWHDADICGKEVLNKETGRIFRITPKNSLAENWPRRYDDLNTFTDEELADLQTRNSEWHARRARLILQNRAQKGKMAVGALKKLQDIYLKNNNADWRLRAMWALSVTGNFSEKEQTAALSDKDPYIRAWAVQMLCEDHSPSTEILEKFEKMAEDESSPAVRLYLAAALQRLGNNSRWEIAENLLHHAEDATDHNIPLMLWFALEPLAAEDPARALALTRSSKIPLVNEYIARRIVDADQTETLIAWLEKNPRGQSSLLRGMRDGLEGRTDISIPEKWTTVYNKLKSDKNSAAIAQEISELLGDTEAARRALEKLKNPKAPTEDRVKALQTLYTRQRPELPALLPALLDDRYLRTEAIKAVAAYDREDLGRQLLERYPSFTTAEKQEAIRTLSSRSRYGSMLTNALKNNTLPKTDVPIYAARQLRRVVGNGFVETWGPVDELSSDKEVAYSRYKKLLSDRAISTANVADGKRIFQQVCGVCHQMYGEGGNIGPDLTGSNRQNVDYLLGNLLDPSGEIQDDYKMVVITTRDGRTYSGNITAENERQLTLRVVGQEAVVLNKSDIQSREESPYSMMPEGLLNPLKDTEILNLAAYLRTREQLTTK